MQTKWVARQQQGGRVGVGGEKLPVSKLQLADEPLLVLVPPVVLVVGRSSVKQVAQSILNTPICILFLPEKPVILVKT